MKGGDKKKGAHRRERERERELRVNEEKREKSGQAPSARSILLMLSRKSVHNPKS